MQEEFDQNNMEREAEVSEEETGTLYSLATEAMKQYIAVYLQLAKETNGFATIRPDHVRRLDQKIVVLGGINSQLDPSIVSADAVVQEWQHVRAVPFEVEPAITRGVYIDLRARVAKLLDELEQITEGFLKFDPDYISANPRMLPILQRLANIPSKAELKKRIGNVSDTAVPAEAARKLAKILNEREPGKTMTRSQLLQSIEPTLEGIVRDLVGRVLLESIVVDALSEGKVPFRREAEYDHLEGVVYNFRADFVIPNEKQPRAFIEVRKSSSRHASLYAKDKMFSAINWKGKNKDLLGVLVVDGPWTGETLKVMTRVIDYVVPITNVSDVVNAVSAYVQGDKSKLRWLIDFAITPASKKV